MVSKKRNLTALLGTALLCFSLAANAQKTIDLQGHRGARGLLAENTLPSFALALEAGVSTLELDVVVTRDDVLVISRDFDAMALVEDELILSLPLVPLHEVCPETLPMSVADPAFEAAAERPNPFGVLAAMKTRTDR